MRGRGFQKLLIANRGEIAVRIIRAARELGLTSVAVYSDADKGSLAVRMADEAVHIGPSQASKSYLSVDAILAAAHTSGAQAIHPGYGFLAENAAFAAAVEAAGLVFVGPTPATIRTMGDKAEARKAAAAAGVPIVPGSPGVVPTVDDAVAVAHSLGYPVMIKASAGGGGRGIRTAENEAELRAQMPLAQAEAKSAFGSNEVYLERYIRRARHIEVQVLGDGKHVIHCFERECSLQRRRQKIWEEAPSAALTPSERTALCTSAVRLAAMAGYRGAGTLEYLFDDERREFYFIEMNTRIQVEHPVTEMVTGIDLVKEMICIARGEPLRFTQADVRLHGTAIEVRINAENPAKGFAPCPGTVAALTPPGGPGVRFDSLLYAGCQIPPFYDSLIAKVIVHDSSRREALARLKRALAEMKIEGIFTTARLHQALVDSPEVITAAFHNGFLEPWLTQNPLNA